MSTTAPLGEIAPIEHADISFEENNIWLLNLDMIESGTGHIIDHVYIDKNLVGNSTVPFDESNVLYSKLRPYLNKVVLPDRYGYATNELLPLKPKKGILERKFLWYFLLSKKFVDYISQKVTGAKMPRANIEALLKTRIPLPNTNEQRHVAETLDKVFEMISLRKQQLSKLDKLVKARFVEMFGDPVSNPKGWDKRLLSEEAEIKIGPFGTMLHKDDYISGGHAIINPSHISEGKISPDVNFTISDNKYQELSAYHLLKNDIVMGRRGEMGRCAVVDRSGLLCGTGSLLIRSFGDLRADYLQKILSFPSFKRSIEDMAVGQTMPNLNVSIVSSLQIIKPPKSVQDKYYSIVTQIDKLKFAIQASLNKLETLKSALMQEYFG